MLRWTAIAAAAWLVLVAASPGPIGGTRDCGRLLTDEMSPERRVTVLRDCVVAHHPIYGAEGQR